MSVSIRVSQPIVGRKNVKYGLNNPNEIQKNALFSTEEKPTVVKPDSAKYKKEKKLQKEHEEILAKDPYAFSFDEVLPEIKKANRAPQQDKQLKPKYTPQLISSAQERERCNNVLYQRKLQRELQADRQLYGEETEVFITDNYKKQIAENQKFEAEEKQILEAEKQKDVTKLGFAAFHRNILDNKNISTGGGEDEQERLEKEQALSLKELKRKREEKMTEEERLKEKDRKRRNRERAEAAAAEAERIVKEREQLKEEKVQQLREEYAKRATGEEEVEAARLRYLERKKIKDKEREQLLAKLKAEEENQ
eukprot:TRINITY_DN12512_c0_g1_i1.p2 TRINITY_DN12512_c0_g1~~TRINITY_DN12512_c0_g1_i1.p2  ORF type:complete len:308 (+),score=110.78 TRINITY_DN12512_c0_g1_i1:49-972(+)